MSNEYTWEQLYGTVSSLVTTEATIKDRLCNACVSRLIRLQPEDFPEELRSEFKEIIYEITKVKPVNDEGNIKASVQAMSTEKAQKIAERIFSLYDNIARKQGVNEKAKAHQ